MEFSEKNFFMTLLVLALIESVFLQDPFGSGSTEVVDRIKLRGRPKDKCRFLKLDKEEFQKCRNLSGSENVTDGKTVENTTKLEPLNGTTSAKEETITTNGTVQRTKTSSVTASERSSTITIESPLDFPIGSTGNISNVTTSEEAGRSNAAASTSVDASASASTITSSSISSTDIEVTITTTSPRVSTTTSESTSSSAVPSISTKSNPTSLIKSTKSLASKKSAKTTLESNSSPSAQKNTRSTKSQKTDVTKSPKKITTSGKIIRNPLVDESVKFLNTTDINKPNNNFTDDNESLAELPEELKQIEDEINEANLGEEPLALFDGQKLKKCGDIVHPISKITFWMKNKNITKEYFDNRCAANYHDSCDDTWRSCAIRGAQLFCAANCSPITCGHFKSFGYDQDDQPFYTIESCNDNPRYKCSYLRERGDCLALDKSISKICPKTCNYCSQSREYLPFMPEQHKLTLWLHKFDNGKYANYAKYIWRQLDLIQNRILAGKCVSRN